MTARASLDLTTFWNMGFTDRSYDSGMETGELIWKELLKRKSKASESMCSLHSDIFCVPPEIMKGVYAKGTGTPASAKYALEWHQLRFDSLFISSSFHQQQEEVGEKLHQQAV